MWAQEMQPGPGVDHLRNQAQVIIDNAFLYRQAGHNDDPDQRLAQRAEKIEEALLEGRKLVFMSGEDLGVEIDRGNCYHHPLSNALRCIDRLKRTQSSLQLRKGRILITEVRLRGIHRSKISGRCRLGKE